MERGAAHARLGVRGLVADEDPFGWYLDAAAARLWGVPEGDLAELRRVVG